MYKIIECNRNNTCLDCDDTECNHHGDISADCQRWICNNSYDCENCDYIKSYVKLMRENNTEKK